MPERRILLLNAHQLVCCEWRGGSVRNEASFENSPDGIAAFGSHVAAHRDSLYTLVANLSEESFQQETIPFLQSRDREAVISRKLSQLFYTTPYTAAFSLGYEKSRRKDEHLLLAALTSPAIVDPWVDALRTAQAAVAGIHSLPFLGESLLKKLKTTDERCILLTLQDQSIRETYFEHGRLHFSRLSPLVNTSIGGIAQAFATEAVKLQQYLLSQRLIARNQALKAIIIAHPQATQAVAHSCISTESLSYDILSTDDCARRIGLGTPPQTSHVDALFAHLAVANAPTIQFAKEDLRHDYRLWQIRTGLYGFGIVSLLACLLYAGKEFYSSYSLAGEAATVAAEARDAQSRYEAIVRTFPAIPASNDTLRQIIDRYAALENDGISPEPLYRDISTALARSPGISIDLIHWKAAGAKQKTINVGAPAERQFAEVRGTIDLGAKATPRQTLADFDRFVAELRNNAALEVKVAQQPFDVDSGKALRSGTDKDSDGSARPFALEILRGAKP